MHSKVVVTTLTFPFIYMTQLKENDLDRAKQLLAEIAAKSTALTLTATRYYQAERYIDVEYDRIESLVSLQERFIAAINPIRDGMRQKDKARLAEATGQVRENLEKYGYRGVGELFRPHISLTRFEREETTQPAGLPSISELSGQFTKLGLFEMGDNGTCVRKIAEFELASS
jgi:hypothetical protein